MEERMLTEREAFRAARCFLQQFNEREHSEAIMLLISWMEEDSWDNDPLETSDPAQWYDWVASVDRVVAERAWRDAPEHKVEVIEVGDGTASWTCSCGASSRGTRYNPVARARDRAQRHVDSMTTP
jgi:hypothetical protein